MSSTSSRGCHSLRQLCPTIWTVKGDAMQSALDNYEAVLLRLEWIAQEDKAEAGSKASGLANIFTKFDTFCGLQIGALVFQQAEQLSRLLQKKYLVARLVQRRQQLKFSYRHLQAREVNTFFTIFGWRSRSQQLIWSLNIRMCHEVGDLQVFWIPEHHLHSLLIWKLL